MALEAELQARDVRKGRLTINSPQKMCSKAEGNITGTRFNSSSQTIKKKNWAKYHERTVVRNWTTGVVE